MITRSYLRSQSTTVSRLCCYIRLFAVAFAQEVLYSFELRYMYEDSRPAWHLNPLNIPMPIQERMFIVATAERDGSRVYANGILLEFIFFIVGKCNQRDINDRMMDKCTSPEEEWGLLGLGPLNQNAFLFQHLLVLSKYTSMHLCLVRFRLTSL